MYQTHLLLELMRDHSSPPMTTWPTLYQSRLLPPTTTKSVLRKHQLFYVRDTYLELNPNFISACLAESGLAPPIICGQLDWWTFTDVVSDYSFALTKREWQSILGPMSALSFSQSYLPTKVTCVGNLVKQRIAVLPLVSVSCPLVSDPLTFEAIHKADREWRKHKEIL